MTESVNLEIKPNIYQRVNNVRKQVSYIKKDAKVQNYDAVTHDAVTALTRTHMIDEGIIVIPHLTRSELLDSGSRTNSGRTIWLYRGFYDISFVNEDDPSDMIVLQLEAHAEDHGDKATGKALSYAVKNALLKMFSLETGVNEEGRIEAGVKKIRPPEIEQLVELCEHHGFPPEATLKNLAAKVYRVTDFTDIPAEYFADAVRRIERKGREASHEKDAPEK